MENSLHYVIDEFLREDRCTARAGDSTANLALLRKVAFNLLRMLPGGAGMTTKDRMREYEFGVDLFCRLFFEPIPEEIVLASA